MTHGAFVITSHGMFSRRRDSNDWQKNVDEDEDQRNDTPLYIFIDPSEPQISDHRPFPYDVIDFIHTFARKKNGKKMYAAMYLLVLFSCKGRRVRKKQFKCSQVVKTITRYDAIAYACLREIVAEINPLTCIQ